MSSSQTLLFALGALLLCGPTHAQQAVSNSALGSGGALSGSTLRLLGSAGQPVAGMASSSSHTSRAGLWYRVAIPAAAPPTPTPAPAPVLAPGISLSVTALALGNTTVGSTAQQSFTVSNSGSASLAITNIGVGGPDGAQFVVSPTTAVIPAGQSQTITVVFAPSSSGPKTAFLVITHNAAGSTSTLSLSGNSIAPELGLSMDLNPAEGDQQLRRAGGLQPGQQVGVQLFIEQAPPIRGFTVRMAFDPRELAFVPGSFAAGSLVPGLLGLADLKEGYSDFFLFADAFGKGVG